MHRFSQISDLTDATSLATIIGPVAKLQVEPLLTIGYSGSDFQRIIIETEEGSAYHFILKKTRLQADWLSLRSNDLTGREVAMLEESSLQKLWQCLHCPYIAFAKENGAAAMLMEDLSDYLFPDVREPVSRIHEDIILNSIAAVHALFWDSKELKRCQWLTSAANYYNILRPGIHEQDELCPPPGKVKDNMVEGWKLAFEMLPDYISSRLTAPPDKIFEPWADLPVTLLHGDLKIANMAILPPGQLVLFDWPMVGCAPCGIELGWYLSVNATRLSRSKEEVLLKYRSCLQAHLGYTLDERLWEQMTELAVFSGAMMMLWSKALGLKSGTQKGKEEWDWWMKKLEWAIGNKQ